MIQMASHTSELERLRRARRDLLDASGLEADSQADLCSVLRKATAKVEVLKRDIEAHKKMLWSAAQASSVLDRCSARGVGGWLQPLRGDPEWCRAWRSLRETLGLKERP